MAMNGKKRCYRDNHNLGRTVGHKIVKDFREIHKIWDGRDSVFKGQPCWYNMQCCLPVRLQLVQGFGIFLYDSDFHFHSAKSTNTCSNDRRIMAVSAKLIDPN